MFRVPRLNDQVTVNLKDCSYAHTYIHKHDTHIFVLYKYYIQIRKLSNIMHQLNHLLTI